jgi:hypothetical protein
MRSSPPLAPRDKIRPKTLVACHILGIKQEPKALSDRLKRLAFSWRNHMPNIEDNIQLYLFSSSL